MLVHRGLQDVPEAARGAVLAIGNFDGVHLGHREVLRRATEIAGASGVTVGILTFEPHPRSLFRPNDPPFRLTLSRDRVHAAAGLGLDQFHEITFTQEFSQLTAEEFVRSVLVDGLGVSHVVVGSDFCFGKGRTGNVDVLTELGAKYGFGCTGIAPVTHDGGIIYSSTAIRAALRNGDPKTAAVLLGRAWDIAGTVIGGDRRGRTIGFPTANVPLGNHVRPKAGVYVVELALDRGEDEESVGTWIGGVANIGIRPSFGGDAEMGLEAHLFDFSGDLYGKAVRVRLLEFIREERKFDGIDDLKAQIKQDADAARDFLQNNPN